MMGHILMGKFMKVITVGVEVWFKLQVNNEN